MNTIKSGANWVESKAKGSSAQAAKETNKSKDPNVRFSTRIRAAKDAVKNTVDEKSHKRQADVHKQGMKHNV